MRSSGLGCAHSFYLLLLLKVKAENHNKTMTEQLSSFTEVWLATAPAVNLRSAPSALLLTSYFGPFLDLYADSAPHFMIENRDSRP